MLAMLAMLAAVVLAGCGQAEIAWYSIPKSREVYAANHVDETVDGPDRMLAAMVPNGGKVWFFKVVGPKEPIASIDAAFRTFVESVAFADGRPTWSLPETWNRRAGDGGASSMRFATLELPGQDDPLELSVTSLDAGTQIDDYYLLQNINRWRRQLTLPRINIDQLPDVIERFDVAGGAAILVTGLVGTFEKSGPMTAPFAPPSGAARPRFAPPQLSYDTPAGWKPGQLVVERGGITVRRQAAFVSGDGADRAEITVTAMPAAGPGMLMNVNRWRKQVGLTPVSTAELDQVFSPFEIGTHAGRFVAFEGRDQTIYGVIAEIERLNWFFKLVGSRSAAARERERFESFVRSAQLGAAGSDDDGRQ